MRTLTIKKLVDICILAVLVFALEIGCAARTTLLFNTALTDKNAQNAILFRLEQEKIAYTVNNDGLILLNNESVAGHVRDILGNEIFLLENYAPFAACNKNNVGDMERTLTQYIDSLSFVSGARVVLSLPDESPFSGEPIIQVMVVLVGVNTDVTPEQVQRIQKILLNSVVGLQAENIVIADGEGNVLNDFEPAEKSK